MYSEWWVWSTCSEHCSLFGLKKNPEGTGPEWHEVSEIGTNISLISAPRITPIHQWQWDKTVRGQSFGGKGSVNLSSMYTPFTQNLATLNEKGRGISLTPVGDLDHYPPSSLYEWWYYWLIWLRFVTLPEQRGQDRYLQKGMSDRLVDTPGYYHLLPRGSTGKDMDALRSAWIAPLCIVYKLYNKCNTDAFLSELIHSSIFFVFLWQNSH